MTVAQWIVNLVMIYAVIGVVFAVAFVGFAAKGVGRIDPSAKGTPVGFRLLILPGVAALWPVLLKRWLSGQTHPPVERNPHRQAAREVTR